MDMGLYIKDKFNVDINKELSLKDHKRIYRYFQKHGLDKLGDNGSIACQLLSNWLHWDKIYEFKKTFMFPDKTWCRLRHKNGWSDVNTIVIVKNGFNKKKVYGFIQIAKTEYFSVYNNTIDLKEDVEIFARKEFKDFFIMALSFPSGIVD